MAAIRRKIPTPPDGQLREAELIPIENSQENSNTYELSDGSLLTLKTVVTEICRVDGVYDQEGNPQYVAKSGNIASVTSPEALRRKTS